MEKVVLFFKPFTTIFYFEFFEFEKTGLDLNQVGMDLKFISKFVFNLNPEGPAWQLPLLPLFPCQLGPPSGPVHPQRLRSPFLSVIGPHSVSRHTSEPPPALSLLSLPLPPQCVTRCRHPQAATTRPRAAHVRGPQLERAPWPDRPFFLHAPPNCTPLFFPLLASPSPSRDPPLSLFLFHEATRRA
jgi:hypothetical protein